MPILWEFLRTRMHMQDGEVFQKRYPEHLCPRDLYPEGGFSKDQSAQDQS